jgi:rRNA pseudouridine-1189 N-methylase Emg1 (Nep1/Mra1 family)
VGSVRSVLPSNWEKFNFPPEELQERPFTSFVTSYVPHGDQEQRLIQQSELNNLESLKAKSRCSGIVTAAEEVAG